MINVNDIKNISSLLSSLFHFGLSNQYSYNAIEERIGRNKYIRDLEDGDASFLIDETEEEIVGSAYSILIEDQLLKTTPLSLWLGEVYTTLFFRFHKSFYHLFLRLPLSKAIDAYPLYHEMDMSEMASLFADLTRESTILKALLKRKDMATRDLSVLSGVKYHTLANYLRSDKAIYHASADNIYKLSKILDAPMNVFVEDIGNYTYSGMYDFDKANRQYRDFLGFYIACYFSASINEENYHYDEKRRQFISGEDIIESIWMTCDADESLSKRIHRHIENIDKKDVSNRTLVLFDYRHRDIDDSDLAPLEDIGFEEIFVVSDRHVFRIRGKIKTFLYGDKIRSSLIIRAKSVLGDFAL